MRSSFAFPIVLVLVASTCAAQPPAAPAIGAYVDADGTQNSSSYTGGATFADMYLVARGMDQVGAVRLVLEPDPPLVPVDGSVSLAPGAATGDLLSGVEIVFDPVLPSNGGGTVLLGSFTLFFFGDGRFYSVVVGPHPGDETVLADAADGQGWLPVAGNEFLFIMPDPVAGAGTWGEIKAAWR